MEFEIAVLSRFGPEKVFSVLLIPPLGLARARRAPGGVLVGARVERAPSSMLINPSNTPKIRETLSALVVTLKVSHTT